MDIAPKNNAIEGKDDISLIPFDLLVPMLCPTYLEGVIKYERESWRKGFYMTVMFAACMRHIFAFFFKNESYDPETFKKYGIKKHHLGAAIFCLINMYNTDMNFPILDDRPNKKD